MLDIQNILHNAVSAKRAETLKDSEQVTLGELILMLEAVLDKTLPVYFDNTKKKPVCIGSWRGSYSELYISYEPKDEDGYNSNIVEWESDDGQYKDYKTMSTKLPKKCTGQNLLDMLKECKGKTFTGYKGGDYLMGKNTPIWVASYGSSDGFLDDTQGIIGVQPEKTRINLITRLLEY